MDVEALGAWGNEMDVMVFCAYQDGCVGLKSVPVISVSGWSSPARRPQLASKRIGSGRDNYRIQ